MTPPDSGERNPFLSRNAQWLRDNDTKPQPDSDEREACVVCRLPATRGDDESGRKYWCGKHGPFYDYVTIRTDLAQRILAHMAEVDSALGSDDWKPDQPLRATLRALIGELRDRMPK